MYKFRYPSSIGMFVTKACNLRCRHCLVNGGTRTDGELTGRDWYRIIDYALHRGILCIDISGGEPTLLPDFPDIVEYAWAKGAKVTVATNGLSVTDELAKRLKDKVQSIRISLDGPDASTHEWLRGPGTFSRTCDAIARMVQLGLPCYAVTVVHQNNLDTLDRMPELIRSLGLTLFQILPLIPVGRGRQIADVVLNARQWKEVLEYAATHPGGVTWYMDTPLSALLAPAPAATKPFRTCLAGYYYLGVMPDGHVIPCPVMDLSIGHIVHDDLDTLWTTSEVLETLRNPDNLSECCNNCRWRDQCNGGCRALAYYMRGDLRCPDPLCWIAYPDV